jgi:hypothetical protein
VVQATTTTLTEVLRVEHSQSTFKHDVGIQNQKVLNFLSTSDVVSGRMYNVNSTDDLLVPSSGGIVTGNQAGSAWLVDQGGGTINAVAVYDDGVGPLTDYVFQEGYKVLSIDEVRDFYTEKEHLPWVPKGEPHLWAPLSLGHRDGKLLEVSENQQLYITELHDRIRRLESQVRDLQDKEIDR